MLLRDKESGIFLFQIMKHFLYSLISKWITREIKTANEYLIFIFCIPTIKRKILLLYAVSVSAVNFFQKLLLHTSMQSFAKASFFFL